MRAIVLLAFGLTLSVAVADLNSAKREGLRRVESMANDMKKLADDTSIEVGKREENIKIISKHAREFGDGVNEKIIFEVKKTAASAYMMAKLLGSRDDVFRCIEGREREGLDDTKKYYNDRFFTPGRDLENRAEEHQRNIIKAWKDDYYAASRQYGDIYRKTVTDIQKATTESTVTSVVRRFEETTKQMADIILSVHLNMAKTHIQVLQQFNELVGKFQDFARRRVDDTTRAINNCFPRLLQEEEEELSTEFDF